MGRNFKDYFILGAKGIAMGAADVVPGVSGGTIAFISGIYEELLETISKVNFNALKVLKQEGIKATWHYVNGNFLAVLLSGIAISIISLAKLITYLMEFHTVLLWSFFFGLILSSIYLVGKKIKQWDIPKIISLIMGSLVAFYITILPPMSSPEALWFIFLSGALAICAMILPGISGSFILLLLGSYEFVLTSLKDVKITIIAVFAAGCITGLLSFSKFLNWMFKKYHDLTIALLTGFLVGSLNKIWPWKKVLETRINSHGKEVPFIDENVLPQNYDGNNQLLMAILFVFIGLALITVIEKTASKRV
jgi:putative membrane protein